MTTPNVSFVRPEMVDMAEKYQVIADCLNGQDAIKNRDTLYLPKPNPKDTSEVNRLRYVAYKRRAMFANFVRRTINGLSGQVFARDPVSEIPNSMDVIELDADGSGVSLVQLSKRSLNFVLSYGRGGVYVDYPDTAGQGPTAAEIKAGIMRPTINVTAPQVVINWRTRTVGAKKLLSLVVIAETWPYHDDGFEIKYACQYRVMQLDEMNQYVVTIYREESPRNWDVAMGAKKGNFNVKIGPFKPTDYSGQPFGEIPFLFIGAENNDSAVDNPPIYDLCVVNIAHYRNSADYEEACFILGQPTYVLAGLDKDWVDNVLKGEVHTGSIGGIMLPKGGTATLLQPAPNTMVYEAMGHKEKLMIALGAKYVEPSVGSVKTATEARQNESSETSFLAASANNVTAAMEWALKWCGKFMGIPEDATIKYALNTDFDISKLSPEARKQIVAEWQADAITFSEMRNGLRKAGVATEDDAEALAAIGREQADALAFSVKEQAALTPPDNPAIIDPPKPAKV